MIGHLRRPMFKITLNKSQSWLATDTKIQYQKDFNPLKHRAHHHQKAASCRTCQLVGRATCAPSSLPPTSHCCRYEAFWSWTRGSALIAMQRVAEVSALAHLDHNTHLAIHPKYGTWFSLRAVVVLDCPGLPELPAPLPSPLSEEERTAAQKQLQCAEAACFLTANDRTLCQQLHGSSEGPEAADPWAEWIKLRDVVHLGREYRYCPAQVDYHYRKDLHQLLHTLQLESEG